MTTTGPVQTWEEGTTSTFMVPAPATGVPAPVLSPSGLTAGVTFDASTRTITALPTAASARSGTVRITATVPDTDPAHYDVPFIITAAQAKPALLNDAAPVQTWYRGDTFGGLLPDGETLALTVPRPVAGSPAPVPAASGLPAGITLNTATLALEGTLTGTVEANSTAVITWSNTAGASEYSIPFNVLDRTPVWGYDSGGVVQWAVAQFSSFTAPTPGWGHVDAVYTTTALPNGIVFDGNTLEFYGNPTAAGGFQVEVIATGAGTTGATRLRYDFNVSHATVRPADGDFPAATLAAAGNRDPKDLWNDGTNLYVSDQGGFRVNAYGLASKMPRPSKHFDALDRVVCLAPTGVWGSTALNRLYVVDQLSRLIMPFDLTTKQYVGAEAIPLLEVEGAANVTALWGDGTTLWAVYDAPTNRLVAYKRDERTRDAAKDVGTGVLPAGQHQFVGLWGNSTHFWLADGVVNTIYCIRRSDGARVAVADLLEVGHTVTPRILHAADIANSLLPITAPSQQPRFFGLAYNPATRTTYGIRDDTTSLYAYTADAGTGVVAYDAARSLTLPAGSKTGMTFDGTGLLITAGDGTVTGYTLTGGAYTPSIIPTVATVQTAFGSTNPRVQGMTIQGQNLMLLNRDGDVKAFRNGQHRAVDDIAQATVREAVYDTIASVEPDYNRDKSIWRFAGLATDGDTLWVLERNSDLIAAITDGEPDLSRSLPRSLIIQDTGLDSGDFQPYGAVWNGTALLISAGGGDNSIFGYGFNRVPAPAGFIRGLTSNGTTLWVILQTGEVRGYDLPSTTA